MFRLGFCALLGCLVIAGSALAAPTVTVTRLSGYYLGSGGELTVTPSADLGALLGQAGPFQSFCLERSESLRLGPTYNAQLDTEAIRGGLNNGPAGPGGGDPLDPRTAYLYSQFRAGTLASYDFTPGTGRSNSASALQQVIWYLEDEMSKTWNAGDLQDTFLTAAQSAVDSGAWTGLGSVRALNLDEPVFVVGAGYDPHYPRQSVLSSLPVPEPPIPPVPAPGAVVLVGLGTALVGWLRRERTL